MTCKRIGLVLAMAITALSGFAAPLKEVFADDFLIGSAIGSRDVRHPYSFPMRQDPRELEVLAREFNCITAENIMKWQYIHPQPELFNFDQADEFMAYAEKNGLAVVGHTLVWHSQTPDWLFKDETGNPVTRDVLIERMRKHIHTVVGRYKGRIKYWDVVNEAVDTEMVEDKTLPLDKEGKPQKKQVAFYRDSPWRRIIGGDYIELAFRFAHEADPDALLLYNDFSLEDKEKTLFVADMVRDLKAKGVPIHGIGTQGHWHLDYPSMEDLQSAIDILAATGVKISITELDVGVLPQADSHKGADINDRAELRDELNPYTAGAPADVLARQAEKYKSIFEVLLRNRGAVERVTLWGLSDKYSWLNNYPVRGRTDYPLLFDRNCQPKPAYFAIQELKQNKSLP